jgi:ABC-type ATPase involved in cell division
MEDIAAGTVYCYVTDSGGTVSSGYAFTLTALTFEESCSMGVSQNMSHGVSNVMEVAASMGASVGINQGPQADYFNSMSLGTVLDFTATPSNIIEVATSFALSTGVTFIPSNVIEVASNIGAVLDITDNRTLTIPLALSLGLTTDITAARDLIHNPSISLAAEYTYALGPSLNMDVSAALGAILDVTMFPGAIYDDELTIGTLEMGVTAVGNKIFTEAVSFATQLDATLQRTVDLPASISIGLQNDIAAARTLVMDGAVSLGASMAISALLSHILAASVAMGISKSIASTNQADLAAVITIAKSMGFSSSIIGVFNHAVSMGLIQDLLAVPEDSIVVPTSYIRTTSGPATRNADQITSSDLSWLEDGQGTFYIETEVGQGNLDAGIMNISDGTLNNRITVTRSKANESVRTNFSQAGGSAILLEDTPFAANAIVKISFSYKAGDLELLSGTGTTPDTSTATDAIPTNANLTTIELGRGGAGITQTVVWIRKLFYWKEDRGSTFLHNVNV